MIEFLNNCFSPGMLVPSVLLALCLFYWLLVIVGVLGMEAFDFDVDPSVDVDAGVDLDTGTDIDAAGHSGPVVESLKFFHLGEVPLMIVLSIFAISFWTANYAANQYFNPEWSGWLSVVWFGPSLLLGLFITKLILMPSARIFAFKDNAAIDRERLIGAQAIVTTSEVTDAFGQAAIQQEGPPITLNVRVEKGDHFQKSEVVTIYKYDRDSDTFIVKPADFDIKV